MAAIIFPSLVIFLVVFSCLFYGSVTILPVIIIETVIGIAILLWLIDMCRKGRLSFLKTGLFLPLVLFLGLVLFQLVPLPIDLIRIVSGHTAHLYEGFNPSGVSRAFATLSIYANISILELFKLLAYIGIFFLVINKIETKKQFEGIINAIVFLGVFISIFGIIQKYTYKSRVYWFDVPGSAVAPFGPFVNRNNFSGYINMIIPLSLGCFLANKSWLKKTVYGFSIWLMVLALFMSSSRAGMLIYILVLLFMFSLSQLKQSLRVNTRTLLIYVALVFFLSIFYIDLKEVFRRFANLFDNNTLIVFGHGYSWWDILRIWRDSPLFGTGLGTFGSISSMYKTTPAQVLFSYAHNDYLQLLSEVGLMGLACLSLFFISYFRKLIKIWLKRHNSYVVSLVLGGMASVFAMLAYSLLDFNLQIPANAILFFVIMALTYRMAYTRFININHGISK